MRTIILSIACLFILSFNLQSQNLKTGNSFITNDLSTLIDTGGNNPETWPWNGCKEFTINVKIKVVEVEFVILICCAQGVCAPYNTKKSPFSSHKQIDVTQSSKVNYGPYSISIAKGKYNIDSQGRPMNLNFLVEKS